METKLIQIPIKAPADGTCHRCEIYFEECPHADYQLSMPGPVCLAARAQADQPQPTGPGNWTSERRPNVAKKYPVIWHCTVRGDSDRCGMSQRKRRDVGIGEGTCRHYIPVSVMPNSVDTCQNPSANESWIAKFTSDWTAQISPGVHTMADTAEELFDAIDAHLDQNGDGHE